MAILDDIKSGFNTAVDYASKKTDEWAHILELKMALASAEKKLKECYETLGHLFYDTYKTGDQKDEDFLDKIKDIDDLKNDIVRLKDELANVRK